MQKEVIYNDANLKTWQIAKRLFVKYNFVKIIL